MGPPVLPSWAAWLGIWEVSDTDVPVVGEEVDQLPRCSL